MNKLDEMWTALAAYQPQADKEGHGETWATMCREKTSEAARAAWSAAIAAGDAEATAYYASEADRWAQKVIDRINKLNEAQPKQEHGEPVAWLLTEKNINSLQVDSIQLLINRLKHAHHTDLCVRINGQDEWFQADWLKHMVRATPQPKQEQGEPVACERCKQLEEQAYDLLGRLQAANLSIAMLRQADQFKEKKT